MYTVENKEELLNWGRETFKEFYEYIMKCEERGEVGSDIPLYEPSGDLSYEAKEFLESRLDERIRIEGNYWINIYFDAQYDDCGIVVDFCEGEDAIESFDAYPTDLQEFMYQFRELVDFAYDYLYIK